eukprot:COSAG01_NODE_21284_length_909_cov_1.706173_2_plen_71_part_01
MAAANVVHRSVSEQSNGWYGRHQYRVIQRTRAHHRDCSALHRAVLELIVGVRGFAVGAQELAPFPKRAQLH